MRIPRRFLAIMMAFHTLATCAAAKAADAPLRVDITQGKASLLIVGVPDVSSATIAGVADGAAAGEALAAVVRADLSSTALYRILRGKPVEPGAPVSLPAWQSIGAQALVVGRPSLTSDGKLAYECLLYDVFGSKQDASRFIVVPVNQWRRAAHQCADMVFEQTTGDPGHFDTRLLYVAESGPRTDRRRSIAIADYDGAGAHAVSGSDMLRGMPRFSRDARAVAWMELANDTWRLVLAPADGEARLRKLQLPEGQPSAPRLSPDGRRLAFALARNGDTNLWIFDLTTGQARQITQGIGIDTNPDWSPDGSQIVFESDRSGQQQIYIMASDGSQQKRISFGAVGHAEPAWSPRGDLIAFTGIAADAIRIGVMKTDGSSERLLTDGWQDEAPSWAPSGRALVFSRTTRDPALPEVWELSLPGGGLRRVLVPGGASQADWSGRLP